MNRTEGSDVLSADLYRHYVETSLRELVGYVSRQTGFLHVLPGAHEGIPAQAAPTKENFLYALLLLRRKTHETIQEGRALLSKLLFFQNGDPSSDQYGNFPVLLTDYPECRNWHLPVFLCLVMTAIETSFGSVLGEELQQRLHAAHRLLFSCAQRNAQKYRLHGWEAFVMAIQDWFLHGLENTQALNDILTRATAQFIEEREWQRPDGFGLTLVALSHVPPSRLPLIDYAQQLWHPQAATYAGPALDVRQFGSGPATTLFDLCLSLGKKTPLPARPWCHQTALGLALITPGEWNWPEPSMPISSDTSFAMWSLGSVTVSACLSSQASGCHPVRIVTPSCTIALVFPNGTLRALSRDGSQFSGQIQVSEIKETDPCLLRAYVERNSAVQLLVGGRRASTFLPEEGITIADTIPVHLALDACPAQCFGHVGLGNRPGQMLGARKGECEVFDWKISIDILRGEIENEVKFSVRIGD
jgi:hypothetical protein